MEIRTAAPQDLPAVTRLEALCFPPAEAAPKAAFRDRLAACPQTCWLLWEGDTLLAMVNGMTSRPRTSPTPCMRPPPSTTPPGPG